MIAKELEGILVSTEEALGGAACFNGTRVHANRLFDYVLTVETLDEFLENYPEVIREHAEAVLAWERQRVREISESERAS